MFESGGSGQVGAGASGALSDVPEVEWTAVLRDRHAAIARAQFLEVDAVASVYLARCAADARRGCNEAFQGEFAHVEVGVMLTVTEPVARRWIGLGLDLRWRLHATSEAFAAGRIDQARAQAISDALVNVSPEKVELVERLLLEGVDGATTSTIRRSARRLVARHDPAGAKARREQGEADRDVRFRANDDGTCSVEGTLPGPAGQVVAMRLRQMCFDVCANDPRTFAQRRADAFVALADGSGRLRCQCGRGDCTQKTRAADQHPAATGPSGNEESASVEGDSTTEAGRADRGTTDSAAVPGVDASCGAAATDAGANSHTGAVDAGDGDRGEFGAAAVRALPPTTIHVGVNLTTLLGLDDLPGYLAGHGWIDADLAREIAADGTWRKVLTLTEADREALLDALCGGFGSGPERASAHGPAPSDELWLSGRRVDTLAHGPILGVGRALAAAGITPSEIRKRSRHRREQLTYRPSQRLAEIVRARDGICRFPGCTVRAIACDIDHTVPFDHANPGSGGQTVEQNLACLCRRHHRLKTYGRWKVRQLGGGRLEWTTPTGELVCTEPAGEFSAEAAPPDEMSVACSEVSASTAQTSDEIAAALGITLTDPAEMHRLFGQPRGRGVEADLRYVLDSTPKPIAVIDDVCNVKVHDLDLDHVVAVDDEPAPF